MGVNDGTHVVDTCLFFFFSFRRCSVRASRSSVEYAAIFLVSSIPTVFLGSYYLHAWMGGGGFA